MCLAYFSFNKNRLVQTMACLLFTLSLPAVSASLPERAAILDDQQQLRQQQRERALQQKNQPESDVRLSLPAIVLPDYPRHEQPCFTLHRFQLNGDKANQFQWALAAVNSAKGRCLGSKGIGIVMNKVQNAILAKG